MFPTVVGSSVTSFSLTRLGQARLTSTGTRTSPPPTELTTILALKLQEREREVEPFAYGILNKYIYKNNYRLAMSNCNNQCHLTYIVPTYSIHIEIDLKQLKPVL